MCMYSSYLSIKSEASVTLDARVFRDEAAIVNGEAAIAALVRFLYGDISNRDLAVNGARSRSEIFP